MATKLNAFFLLLTFGLLCGLVAGVCAGWLVSVWLILLDLPNALVRFQVSAHDVFVLIIVMPLFGIWFALMPGILFGLMSRYFTKKWHWLFDGALCGAVAIPLFTSMLPGVGGWPVPVICVAYGGLVGAVNRAFPRWWGMRLRARALASLR